MAPSNRLFCSQCDFTTEKEKKLSKHMRKKHSAVKDGVIAKKMVTKDKTKDNQHESLSPKKKKKSKSIITMPDITRSVKSEILDSHLGLEITSQRFKTSCPSTQPGQDITSPLESHCSMKDANISKKKLPQNKRISLSGNGTLPDVASSVKLEIPDTQLGHEKTVNGSHADTQPTQPGQKITSQNLNVDTPPTALTCPFCKSDEHQFSSLKALSAHKKTYHKEIVLNCCFCEFSTSVLRKWHKHLRKNHCQNIDPLLKFLNIYIQQNNLDS